MRLVLDQKASDKSQPILICPKRDYQRKAAKEEHTLLRTVNSSPEEQIAIIREEEAKIRTMSITKVECLKCANKEAYWWMVQTRGSDESPTQFFRCTKCNYTWREIS
jgi:DNA-directed RNA polymerase subunit M